MSLRITWDGVRSWAAQSCSNACFLRGSMRSVKRAVFFSTCPRRRRWCRTLTCDEHLIPLVFPWRPAHPRARAGVAGCGAVAEWARRHTFPPGDFSPRGCRPKSGGTSFSMPRRVERLAGRASQRCCERRAYAGAIAASGTGETRGSAPATSPSFPAPRRRRVAAGTRPDPGHRSPRAPCPRTARTSSCAGRGSRP